MNHTLAITALAAYLPFVALGDDTKLKPPTASELGQMIPASATNHDAGTLSLRLTCRSGAVVTLHNASLVEQRQGSEGSVPRSTGGTTPPVIRLNMPEAGTVTIPWSDIEKIAVGDRGPSELTYAIAITLKNGKEPKMGKTYGNDNTVVGRSDAGEFSIALKDVSEIIVLPHL